MIDYQLLVLAHLLLFVYWLGGDFAVFYSSRYVADASLSVEARLTAARILLAVDQLPRFCLILMLPVGFTLSSRLGLFPLNSSVLLAIWIASAFWVFGVTRIHHYSGQAIAKTLQRVDLVVRLLVVAGLFYVSITSLVTGTPIAGTWLAAKILVFAIIVCSGLAIRLAFAPFGAAFGQLASTGSTPEVEKTISTALARTKPFVIVIWIGLITNAWLGLTKPPL